MPLPVLHLDENGGRAGSRAENDRKQVETLN
jgi:hypothetical protein